MKNEFLKNIICDKTSGSAELVLRINNFLKVNVNNKKLIANSINKINCEMRHFEAVVNYLKSVQNILSTGNREELEKFTNNFINIDRNSNIKIYQNLKQFIRRKNRVFTLSNSHTVFEVLKLWFNDDKKLKVIVAESRPEFEGRIFSKKLLKLGMQVKITTDFQIADSICKSDVILLGADKILSNFDVVNKIGSNSAGIIAKYYRKKVFVVTSNFKLSKERKSKPILYEPKKVWSFNHPNLKIENSYFEIIPRELITKIITESNIY